MFENVETKENLSTFMIHYTPLRERRDYLIRGIPKELEVYWVTEKDIAQDNFSWMEADFSETVLGVPLRKVALDLGVNSRSQIKPRLVARLEGIAFDYLSRFFKGKENLVFGSLPKVEKLNRRILDVTRMHLKAIQEAKALNTEWTLILEDDAIFDEGFLEQIRNISLWENRRAIWVNLNSGANLSRTRFDRKPNSDGIFELKPASTRCATAYMINRIYLEKSIEIFQRYGVPNFLPIDVIFQVMNRSISAKSFWSHPPTVIQGSEAGLYSSNLRNL